MVVWFYPYSINTYSVINNVMVNVQIKLIKEMCVKIFLDACSKKGQIRITAHALTAAARRRQCPA